MKGFFKALGDFLTDSNGEGDVVRLAGLALIVLGGAGWWNGKDPTILFAIGSTLIMGGKLADAVIPQHPGPRSDREGGA